jgi:hypothetical protein
MESALGSPDNSAAGHNPGQLVSWVEDHVLSCAIGEPPEFSLPYESSYCGCLETGNLVKELRGWYDNKYKASIIGVK